MPSRTSAALASAFVALMAVPHAGLAESLTIFSGSVAVDAVGSHYYSVTVSADQVHDAVIVGHVVANGGSGNDIQVLVLTASDFLNWKNDHTAHPLYNSGQVTAADIQAAVTEPGTYYVVFSNSFSAFTPKTVEGSIRLSWTPPLVPAQPMGASPGANAMLGLAVVFLVVLLAVLLGGYVWWWVARQERKKASASEKKAA